jgi:soluble lytic murein transglycosylase
VKGRQRALLLLTTLAIAAVSGHQAFAQAVRPAAPLSTSLSTTAHPPLPGHPSLYWLVPDASATPSSSAAQTRDTAVSRFARGAALIADGNYTAGLPLVTNTDLDRTPLAHYGRYYAGVALLGLQRLGEADALLTAVVDADPGGYLEEAAPLRLAEVALARSDPKRAVALIDDVADETLVAPEEALLRLGVAAEAGGDRAKALEAFRRVYYEFPLSQQANEAQSGIERLQTPALVPADLFKMELARAERLFSARRWAQARAAFAPLTRAATGDDGERVALRLAECDYYLDRHRAARDALRPFLDKSSRETEARFFHLTATRALGDVDTYVALARALLEDEDHGSWVEETLNNLASHYIIVNDDAEADRVFRELYRRFPQGRYADRAAWKIGWWAYKSGQFAETAEIFEAAAGAFPRADYRPAWLYWAGRARDQMGTPQLATSRYRLVASDYLNSYYGRLASAILASRREPALPVTIRTASADATPRPLVPNDAVIRALAGVALYDDALREVQYAQRAYGDSPALQATVAWIRHQRALGEQSNDRFADLRGAIILMRRAYPQFLAAGGEQLPPDILRVIFPLDYWPLIKKHAEARGLDPYLMTALIAQESTFTRDVRSSANAVGLMQLIPGTARRYARKLGIRYTAATLTQAETNIRLGMTYFKDLVDRFGGAHFALASYNAGESRIAKWITERPGMTQDEFIDDIPFPETQNYVKRILGTAEDYRRLYGDGILAPGLDTPAAPQKVAPKAKAPARKAPARKPAPRPSRRRR